MPPKRKVAVLSDSIIEQPIAKKEKKETKEADVKTVVASTLDIYCDGSAKHNGKPGCRCGYGIFFKAGDARNTSEEIFDRPSNNRAELYAILNAINIIIETKDIDSHRKVVIHSDSEYSIKSLTVWMPNWKKNGWKTASKKPVENQDLLKKIDSHLQTHKHISFNHVYAHTNSTDAHSIGNDNADRLAKRSIGM
jgi:ribonuclease HI